MVREIQLLPSPRVAKGLKSLCRDLNCVRIAPDRGKLGWKEISSPQVCCWLLGSHQELQELCHLSSCELRVTCKAQPGAAGASASRVLALLCGGQDLFWSSGRAGVGFAVGFVCVRWG